uniref:C2H2-type domain-containing protein n=1 Tax=Hyaloperonospora arabidopsidis (strain Emoy2) TaxID=559515 RepID=M4BW74_HYAAE
MQQPRELRPKRALLALLQRLNDCVSVSARRLLTQQLPSSTLLQLPRSELQQLLPELCVFIHSLLPSASTTNNRIDNTATIILPLSTVRRVFSHPDAQWLSRSARQSGISALLCQQLVRLARLDQKRDPQSQTDRDCAVDWSMEMLVTHILLDALLLPCAQRLGQAPDACKWRPLQPKPRFHAMTCFPVWSSLLPFAAQMGIRFPNELLQVLEGHWKMDKTRTRRVHCEFALVTGTWRLVDELDRGDKEKQRAVTAVMVKVLRVVSDKLLACTKNGKAGNKLLGLHLDDQLLEKFFAGMLEFLCKSGRADAVLRQVLFGTIQEVLVTGATSGVASQHVVIFTTAGCMLVKDLAAGVISMIVKHSNGMKSHHGTAWPLAFLAGFSAHVDLVPLRSVLEVLELLVISYKAVNQTTYDIVKQRQRRLELVFYIMYVTLHRCKSVDLVREDVSSDAAAVLELVTQFQMQLCSEISYEDFHTAAPVHWTAQVWKHWVFLSDEDVQSFVSEAHENDVDSEVDFEKRIATWCTWEAQVTFRPSLFLQFPLMKTLVNPHLISSTPLIEPDDDDAFVVKARKRRRIDNIPKSTVDLDLVERCFDVLLQPDALERVCSFMSAKRLCRMALVCRTFAEVSRRGSLWSPLYLQLGLSTHDKPRVLPALPVQCRHGDRYEHKWRQMYQERWKVLRKLRRVQRRVITANHISEDRTNGNEALHSSSSTFLPLICSYCGCNEVLKSARDHDVHMTQHKRFTCSEPSCQASFTKMHKLQQHVKTNHASQGASARRLVCGYNGCTKNYLSVKRLATHCKKTGHLTPIISTMTTCSSKS